MKRSFLGLVFAAGLALMASAAIAVERCKTLVVSAYERSCTFLLDVVAAVAPAVSKDPVPQVQRIQAKQFQARIEKRERPVITSSWRMCPSA